MIVMVYPFENHLCIVLIFFIYNFGAAFLDAVIDSITVEQARKDPINGQQDLQCFQTAFFGLGAFIGSIVGAFSIEYYSSYAAIGFGAFICLILTIAGFYTSDELETNEYAQ